MAGLFDIFSNTNAQQAASDQISGLNQGYGLASTDINQALQALQQQYGFAGGALQSGATGATNAINAGAGTATNAINQGAGTAANALSSNYASALLPFMQNYGQAQQGTTQLGNALGLNGGAAGAGAAASAYASNPAYQFQLQQGDQNVLRNGAQTGTLASGQTLNALQTQGQGLANSTYQQYVQNLMPYLGQSSTAAAGIGNTYTGLGSGLAGIATGAGTNLANIATGQGSQLAGISTGLGAGQAGIDTGLGNATAGQYGNLANLGWQFATGTGNANANAALANNTASANMINGLGSVASLGAFMLSDERVKTDIEPVGELYDGSNVYRYRYLWDDPAMSRIGLMAQEVEQTNPDAVREFGGVKAVDYSKATDYASLLAKFQNSSDQETSGNDNVSSLMKFLAA